MRHVATLALASITACGLGKDVGEGTDEGSVDASSSSSGATDATGSAASSEAEVTSASGTSDLGTTGSGSESGALPGPDCACLPEEAQPAGDMLATPMCVPTLCSVYVLL